MKHAQIINNKPEEPDQRSKSSTPLLDDSSSDPLLCRNALQGTLILGAPGGGATSGSGRSLVVELAILLRQHDQSEAQSSLAEDSR